MLLLSRLNDSFAVWTRVLVYRLFLAPSVRLERISLALCRPEFNSHSAHSFLAPSTGVPSEWQFPNLRSRCLQYPLSDLHSSRRRLVSSEFSRVSCDSLMIVRAISCLDTHQLIRNCSLMFFVVTQGHLGRLLDHGVWRFRHSDPKLRRTCS